MVKKIFLNIAVIYLGMLLLPKVAYAQAESCAEVCDNGQWSAGAYNRCVFAEGGVAALFDSLGIDRTSAAGNVANGIVVPDALNNGAHPEEVYRSACENLPQIIENGGALPVDMIQKYAGSTRHMNSLIGAAISMGNTLDSKDAIPINFAYYVKDQAKHIPFVSDTAFAQGTSFEYMGADFVLALWKQTRKIAYGLIALALIFTGVMIMLRKQLPSKTAVTVQYALPRLILALVLITFSYPIASLGIALIPLLRNIGSSIIYNVGLGFGLSGTVADFNSIHDLPLYIQVMSRMNVIRGSLLSTAVGAAFGLGLGSAMASTYVMLLWLLCLIIAFIKSVIIQIQIMGHVIFAPITLAWSTIPGNEKLMSDWFKKLAAKILAVPAMFLYIAMAKLIIKAGLIMNVDVALNTYLDIGAAWESMLVWLFIPFISSMILISSLSLPGRLEKSIMGETRR